MSRSHRAQIIMKAATCCCVFLYFVASFFWVSEARATKGTEIQRGFRAELVHLDSPQSPFNQDNKTAAAAAQWLQRAVTRSKYRVRSVSRSLSHHRKSRSSTKAAQDEIEAPVYLGKGEYLMKMGIGSPALEFYAILDTGSDLTWTQCQPCEDCYRQATPIYNPARSSSYSKVPCRSSLCSHTSLPDYNCKDDGCEYEYTYGDYSLTVGVLSYETFSFGPRYSVPLLAFGCGRTNEGNGFKQAAGIVGLGRGPLSLITQLSSPSQSPRSKAISRTAIPNKFSYCLVSIQSSPTKQSPLFLGEFARLNSKFKASSTPLITNPKESTFYFVALEGISIGSTLLKIPRGTFDIQSDGSGGMIVDSGTTVTYLEQAGYDAVREHLSGLIRLPTADGSATGLDLCYRPPASRPLPLFPNMVFHFKGADFVMGTSNYMVKDTTTGLLCLGMLPNTGMSILGNVQQQNFHILYDVENSLFSFQHAACDSL